MSRVSVIIPAYNAEKTVGEALRSVLAQSCSVHEIWVIDDASADGTLDVVRRFADEHDIISSVSLKKNAGPAAARNEGLRRATGDWIAFLDGDDAWLPYKVEVQLRIAERHPEIVLWSAKTMRLTSAESSRPRLDSVALSAENFPFRETTREELLYHNPFATSATLVRADVVRDVGGFDEQFVGPEDYDLWMRIAERHALGLVEHPLSLYRHVPGSLSMDDRCFLPQVLLVLEKALSPAGCMSDMAHLIKPALGNQYWNASWMAFNRGARGTALRYWCKAYQLDHCSERVRSRPWFPLLYRYCLGRPIQEGEMESMGEDR